MTRTDVDNVIRKNIALRHLQQLRSALPQYENATPPERQDGSIGLELLKYWSRENKDQIAQAVANQIYGGKLGSPIDWKCTFLAFMECCGTYLRDWGKVLEAAQVYRQAQLSDSPEEKESEEERAIKLLDDSQAQIVELARMWGMDFQIFCDMVKRHPDGKPTWDGPYCGGFYSAGQDKQFIGIAFKGTDPLRYQEWIVDANYKPRAVEGYAFSQAVSTGVFTGMFSKFGPAAPDFVEEPDVPYDLIHQALGERILLYGGQDVTVHVTGHSLGGSYANLCFAQLLQELQLSGGIPPQMVFGDMYTFGCPRIGQNPFAKAIRDNLGSDRTGSSWRIVNYKDLVAEVPPLTLLDPEFVHLDVGYTIKKDSEPEKINSEIGTHPKPPFSDLKKLLELLKKVKAHVPNAYYDALLKAMGV